MKLLNSSGISNSVKRKEMSQSHRQNISDSKKGNSTWSVEHRQKMEKHLFKEGVPQSLEHRSNISASLKGKPKSEQHKKKLQETLKKANSVRLEKYRLAKENPDV